MKQPRTWILLSCILLYAAVCRIAYLLLYRAADPLYAVPIHDAQLYHEWAAAIAGGAAWQAGAFYQAPGYPYLLSLIYRLFGAEPVAAYLLQMVLGLLSILLIYRIAARAYGTNAGLAAAALAALYGLYPYYETKLLGASTALFIACLIVDRLQVADELPRGLGHALAGVAIGMACVTRPTFLLLAPLVLVWIAADRSVAWPNRLRRLLICLVCISAVIAPVTIRNYLVSGEPVLISNNGGVTFYHGNNDQAWGVYTAPGMSGAIRQQREESRKLAEASTGRPMTDAEVSGFFYRRGLAYIMEDPLRYLGLLGRKAFLAIDNYEHPLEYSPRLDPNPARYLFPLSFGIILVLAVSRIFAPQRVTRQETPILLVLVPQVVTALLFFAASRYRLPATGPLLAIAGCGAITLLARVRAGWRKAWAPLLVALVLLTVSFVKLPPFGEKGYRAGSVASVCDIGFAYTKTGKLDEAVGAYRKAIEWNPAYAYAHLDLGKVLMELGRLDEAEQSLSEAIRLEPNLAEAHFDLGNLYLKTNRLEPAEREFSAAFRLDPGNEAAGSNLIGVYLTEGRHRQAVRLWRDMKERGLEVHPGIASWMERNAPRAEPARQD